MSIPYHSASRNFTTLSLYHSPPLLTSLLFFPLSDVDFLDEGGQKTVEGGQKSGMIWDENDKSIEAASKDLDLNPEFPNPYSILAQAYEAKGDTDFAVANYLKAAQLGHETAIEWLRDNCPDILAEI